MRLLSEDPAEASFAAVAASLREAVISFYAVRGQTLKGSAGSNTLETNSGYVARRTEPLLEFVRRHSAHGSLEGLRVADLGCGFGAMSLYLAARGAQVTGLDPNGQRFEVGRAVAAQHGLDIDFVAGRMERLTLPDGGFDLAVQNNSLCYLVDPEQRRAALEDTHRILRPGGVLISRNPNRWHPLDQFTGLPFLHLLPPGAAVATARRTGRERSLVRLTSPLSARRELRRAGFVRVVQAGFPGGERPAALKWWARYHHFVASRPEQ